MAKQPVQQQTPPKQASPQNGTNSRFDFTESGLLVPMEAKQMPALIVDVGKQTHGTMTAMNASTTRIVESATSMMQKSAGDLNVQTGGTMEFHSNGAPKMIMMQFQMSISKDAPAR